MQLLFIGIMGVSYSNSLHDEFNVVDIFLLQERDSLGQKMMSFGIAELFQRIWKMHSDENFVDKATDPLYVNLSNVMVVMWNMTDKCTALCEHSLDIGVHKDALKYMNAIDPQDTSNLRYACKS